MKGRGGKRQQHFLPHNFVVINHACLASIETGQADENKRQRFNIHLQHPSSIVLDIVHWFMCVATCSISLTSRAIATLHRPRNTNCLPALVHSSVNCSSFLFSVSCNRFTCLKFITLLACNAKTPLFTLKHRRNNQHRKLDAWAARRQSVFLVNKNSSLLTLWIKSIAVKKKKKERVKTIITIVLWDKRNTRRLLATFFWQMQRSRRRQRMLSITSKKTIA